VRFAYDYGQLYIYDATSDVSADGNPYIDALDAATESGLSVGVASGIVDVLMPRQENFGAEIEVMIAGSPRPIEESADHIVEFDLESSGQIKLEGSGGSGELEVEIPQGRYRARLSGFGFDAAAHWSYGDPDYPTDRYRLELWPADSEQPPAELRRWAGYDERS
jgi:hypothetical protein